MKIDNNEATGGSSDLLARRAGPRRFPVFMIALMLVGMLSLAGVVSADSYYSGITPVTNWTGTVNGDVYVQYNNTWNSTSGASSYNAVATFNSIPSGITVKEARLYIVPYSGNMTATYTGNLDATWTSNGVTTTLSNDEPLDLSYDRNQTPITRYGPTTESQKLLYLNRVTSDYAVVYNVTDLIDATSGVVNIDTTRVSGNWDGRIKEAKLVIAYDVPSGLSTGTTSYWVNEGNDPITKSGDGTAGVTTFAVPYIDSLTSATLYTDDIASANGVYTWIGNSNTTITPTTIASNSYARLNQFDLTSTIDTDRTSYLSYNRSGSFYKLAVAILKLKY
jgi:hypothetical protein